MKALALLLALPMVLVGCAEVATLPPPATIEEGLYSAETWISGLAYIDNAFVGCNTLTDGLRLHNGEEAHSTTQKTAIGTDPGETVVDVPLRAPLANNDIRSVQSIKSDNLGDSLVTVSYNKDAQTLKVEGFAPASGRIITMTYDAWNRFVLEYTVVQDVMKGYSLPPDGAKGWLAFAPSVIISPGGTMTIPVRFAIPNEYKGKIPLRWEFGLRASDTNQGMINKGVLCTFLVRMR